MCALGGAPALIALPRLQTRQTAAFPLRNCTCKTNPPSYSVAALSGKLLHCREGPRAPPGSLLRLAGPSQEPEGEVGRWMGLRHCAAPGPAPRAAAPFLKLHLCPLLPERRDRTELRERKSRSPAAAPPPPRPQPLFAACLPTRRPPPSPPRQQASPPPTAPQVGP